MNLSTLYHNRFTILLLSLTVFMLFTPLMKELVTEETMVAGRLWILVISTGWVASAAFAVSSKRSTATIAVVLMVISLALELYSTLLPSDLSALTFHVLRMIYLGFIVSALLRHIFKPTIVTFDTISASLCIYLMLGAMWSNIYCILDLMTPGSIAVVVPQAPQITNNVIDRSYHMLYFSFVTLSTVGYGDMVPITTVARMFAVTEAVSGQIYLLVMVSRLVGLQVSQALSKQNNVGQANTSTRSTNESS